MNSLSINNLPITLVWTPALKTAYAEAVMSAMESAKINPRYPKCIYADTDDDKIVTGFDSIAAVNSNNLDGTQIIIDSQFDADAMGDWSGDYTVLDIVDCLEANGAYQAISESIQDMDD